MCEDLAEGQTLYEWCQQHDLLYRAVRNWIAEDPARETLIGKAEEMRHGAFVDQALGDMRTIRTADLRKAYDDEGRPLPIHKLPDSLALALSSSETHTTDDGTTIHKLRLVDRKAGTEMLARHTGIFKDKIEIDATKGLTDALVASAADLRSKVRGTGNQGDKRSEGGA